MKKTKKDMIIDHFYNNKDTIENVAELFDTTELHVRNSINSVASLSSGLIKLVNPEDTDGYFRNDSIIEVTRIVRPKSEIYVPKKVKNKNH